MSWSKEFTDYLEEYGFSIICNPAGVIFNEIRSQPGKFYKMNRWQCIIQASNAKPNGGFFSIDYHMGDAHREFRKGYRQGDRRLVIPSSWTSELKPRYSGFVSIYDSEAYANSVPSKPNLPDVMHAIYSDFWCIHNHSNVYEFIREMGYEIDDLEDGMHSFSAIQKQERDFRKAFGWSAVRDLLSLEELEV